MARLTYRDGRGRWTLLHDGKEQHGAAVDRLAAYEETGMEPSDFRPAVRAEWVKLTDNKLDGTFFCSACQREIDIGDGEMTPLEDIEMRFCQFCGADMRRS